jgi:hypothetical protein
LEPGRTRSSSPVLVYDGTVVTILIVTQTPDLTPNLIPTMTLPDGTRSLHRSLPVAFQNRLRVYWEVVPGAFAMSYLH